MDYLSFLSIRNIQIFRKGRKEAKSVMCGIVGVVSKNDRYLNPNLIKLMANAIKHRGPDDEGYMFLSKNKAISVGGNDTPDKVWDSNLFYSPKQHIDSLTQMQFNVALGHRRLSILDLSASGHQPMCDESGKVWVVFNGEIYNYIELREELKKLGYRFISNTDTEVLLKSYIEWGFDCVNKFNGMWAFAILDLRKNILFLSRDRFGVKPLYYYLDDENFAFASEIKALLKLPFIKRELNYEAVFDYLAFGWEEQGEESFFKGIKELKPSHSIIINLNNNNFRLYRYYQLSYNNNFEKFDENKAKMYSEELREHIFNAVKIRLRSDVKVGSCLSGGLDSSTIVCVINQLISKENLKSVGNRISCFTASYENDKVDESKWAKIVVEHVKANWIRTYPNDKDLLNDLNDLIYYQEIPFGSTSIYAQYRVMKIASESGVKVLLDGQGGDELFTGYTGSFSTFYRELIYNFALSGLINEILNSKNSPASLGQILKMLLKQEIAKKMNIGFLGKLAFKMVYNISLLKQDFYREFFYRVEHRRDVIPNNLNEELYQLITGGNLKKLLKYEDRNSMRFSIESRTPFADDINLIEYVFKIPSVYKIHNGYSKYILREAMKGILPEAIRKRVDKKGFTTPEDKWLKQNKKFVIDVITDSNILKDVANMNKIKKEIEKESIFNKSFTLWRYLNLALWYKIFFRKG
jgi:asparagine synthase (glutamine-hydrolysing)